MAEPTTFHLIRHASYDMLDRVLAGRTPGHSLNVAGRAEAERVAGALASRPITAVVASPLERAQETAAVIGRLLGLPVRTEPDLNEIDFGDWTGTPFDTLHGSPAWTAFNTFRSTAAIPGGEAMLAAQARAVAAIGRLRADWSGQEIAVVSHGDVVKVLITHFLGVPLDLLRRIDIAPASRSVILLADAYVRVLGVNLPAGA